MGRLLRCALVVSVLAVCVLACSVAGSEVEAEWPTLLEHAAASSNLWAPTPRTRLEKLALAQAPRQPESLGEERNQRSLFFGADQKQQNGLATEPVSNVFDISRPVSGLPGIAPPAQRASRGCTGAGCAPSHPLTVADPAPVPMPASLKAAPPAKPKAPEGPPAYPNPPTPENPLPSPPTPSCGELCNPVVNDPTLARVTPAPFDDEAVAAVGAEGKALRAVLDKLRNREGWLRTQKVWLSKAAEAASVVRREIELAEFTKDAVASDLEELKKAQDALSIRYKANRLKWSFKDRKITMQHLREKLEELHHARADVANQMRAAKDEVTVLQNTLGPPSTQFQISPKELEDPLAFLKDLPEPEVV